MTRWARWSSDPSSCSGAPALPLRGAGGACSRAAVLFAAVIAVGSLVFFGFVGQPLTFLCLPPDDLGGVSLRPARDGCRDRDPVDPGDLGHRARPRAVRRWTTERGAAALAGISRHDGRDEHHDRRRRGGAKAGRGSAGPPGVHRGVLRRRHHQQDARRRGHELERGRGATLRLHRDRGDRPIDLDHHPARSSQRAAPHPGAAQAGRAHPALRDGAHSEGRHARSGLGHGVAAPELVRQHHRRLRDRPRRDREEASRSDPARGGEAAVGREPGGGRRARDQQSAHRRLGRAPAAGARRPAPARACGSRRCSRRSSASARSSCA